MTTRLPLANLLVGSAVVAAAFATAACSGSGSTPAVTPDAITPTIASTVVDGGSDGLAAELLLAGTGDPGRAQWHQEQRPVSDPDVAAALDALALDHVRSTVLGAAGGPNLVGSALVRRLAGATTAPPDSNGRSGNLDETLRAEAERVLAFAGAAPPGLETVPVLPWQSRSAELAAALTPADNTSWATLDLGQQGVRLADVARFLELRITVARRLLGELRRTYYGRDAAAGALGLLAVQQALAAEDALFSGVFTAGGPLGALVAPAEYDPLTAPRWLPAEFAVDLDPAVAGAPAGYAPLDGASDLAALGAMLRAGVELSELGDPTAGPALPGLFRFRPFAPPPSEPVIPVLSWDSEMRGFLRFHCGECHYDEQFGGYSIRSYEEMRTPGFTAESLNLQIVVPGDHEASLLHQIVTNAPFPFTQMPLGGQLLAPEIELIDRWIDEGAVESSPEPPAPPQPGDDLAVVSFRNLAALHFDAATGALHHRVEANGPADFTPSGLATATATGRTLRGLAAFVRRRPDEELAGRTAMQYFDAIVGFASRHQVDPEGAAYDAVEIFTGAPAGPAADLRGQAAMAAGLLAAAAQLPAQSPVHAAAGRAARYLLDAFDAGGDLFGERAGEPATTLAADELADLLAALRLASDAGVDGADIARSALLARLRPALTFAEWDGHGEVLGDGIADTDGNGIPEPAAAGGPFGRLPLVSGTIALGAAPSAPPTGPPSWSRDVRPLFLAACADCHLNGSTEGGYRLDTIELAATPGESQGVVPLLVPGDAEASYLFQKLVSRRPLLGNQMPLLRTPLSDSAITLVRRWIDAGAPAR